MANNYQMWSESISNLTPEELSWVQAQEDYPGEVANESADGTKFLWFCSEGDGYLEGTVKAVQTFLKRFRKDAVFYLTWSETCARPRLGEFGGGLVRITHDTVLWKSTQANRERLQDKDRSRKLLEAYKSGELVWPVK